MSEFGGEAAEVVNELVLEEVMEGDPGRESPAWHTSVAMSTLFMALFTALGALVAGITAHEALLERTQEAIDISIAQNDRVSIEVLATKIEILNSLDQPIDPADLARIASFEEEVRERELMAAEDEAAVQARNFPHLTLAVSVTILSVGITLSGMAVIVNKKYLWQAGLVFGILGAVGVIIGLIALML